MFEWPVVRDGLPVASLPPCHFGVPARLLPPQPPDEQSDDEEDEQREPDGVSFAFFGHLSS